jgi:O-antigen/teichoic acid export membrane protein
VAAAAQFVDDGLRHTGPLVAGYGDPHGAQDILGGIRELDLHGRTLRGHAAQGMIVNAAFTAFLAVLNMIRGLVVAAFIDAKDFGVWGIIVIALGTLTWLKQVGFSEKYIQQEESDQEAAFHKAFTLELIANGLLLVVMVAVIPLVVVVYGRHEIVAPALAVAAVIPAYALQTPVWVFYRRMDFVRQRTLQAVDPVVGLIVATALAAVGAGYWAFVAALLAGAWANAIVVLRASPYRLRLRLDRGTAREYFHFSWPIFAQSSGALLIAQATVITATRSLGLAAVGAITLAGSFSNFAHRVDEIVTTTLYPAVCAVQDRLDVLAETFVKSNRLTLMWGVPFGVGLALFAADLVHYVVGHRWDFAIHLVAVSGLLAAVNHIAFNWAAFHRARNVTRPMAISAWVNVATFAAAPLPLMVTHGLDGYALGLGAAALIQLFVRGYFMARMFNGFSILWHTARAIAPSIPAAGAVLLLRAVTDWHRTAGIAAGELVLYLVITVAATWAFERVLLREALGYLRRDRAAVAEPGPAPA